MLGFMRVERLRELASWERLARLEKMYAEKIENIKLDLMADIASPVPNGYVVVYLSERVMRGEPGPDADLIWFLRDMGYEITFNGHDRRDRKVEVYIYWRER